MVHIIDTWMVELSTGSVFFIDEKRYKYLSSFLYASPRRTDDMFIHLLDMEGKRHDVQRRFIAQVIENR